MRLSRGPDKAPFDQRRLLLTSAFGHEELRLEKQGWERQWEGAREKHHHGQLAPMKRVKKIQLAEHPHPEVTFSGCL